MADPAVDALRRAVAVVDPRRDVVRAEGPDATGYLQGQLSQDLLGVAVGSSTWSWLLAPAGKVDALVRLTRVADTSWLIDTDAGFAPAVAARLARFRLRTEVEVEVLDGWVVRGLRGPATPAPADIEVIGGTAAVIDASWPGLRGVDLIGPDPQLPAALAAAPVASAAAWEAARIAAGVPVMGAELTVRTIPAETGLIDRTVSFTKGCYTGQELVARIDSRGGNVPRRLAALVLGGPAEAGANLTTPEGAEAGTLTSSAPTPEGGWIGLGYVRRAVLDGATVVVGATTATVTGLRAAPVTTPDAAAVRPAAVVRARLR